MGDCLDRGIKVVSNAGGLSPQRCAEAVPGVAAKLGLHPVIAYVEGDDLMPRMAELRAAGEQFTNIDTGEPLGERPVITANAYLGGWGIAEALARGADIVITGRVTDAALVVGPAAWHHGWRTDDWDALAGAVVAGHVIECGAQATGGNFAFFTEVPGLEHPGFPIAEVAADGSAVITKHPGQGGMVSVDTVTAQLLYEIGGPAYLNPDVTARFDSIRLSGDGTDRVRISGVRGDSPPATAKVALNYAGGWRSTLTLYLTGLDIEAKAALVERALWAAIPGGRDAFDAVEVSLLRTDKPDPATNAEAMAQLRITVKAADERTVGRAFSARVTELALASYPGMFGDGLTGGAARSASTGRRWCRRPWSGRRWSSARPATVVEPVLPPDPPVRAAEVAPAAAGAAAGGRAGRPGGAGAAGPGGRGPVGGQGRDRQPGRVGPHRRRRTRGWPGSSPCRGWQTAAGDRAAAGAAVRTAEPARAQLRHPRAAWRGRGGQRQAGSPGQEPRRVAARPDRGHPGGADALSCRRDRPAPPHRDGARVTGTGRCGTGSPGGGDADHGSAAQPQRYDAGPAGRAG